MAEQFIHSFDQEHPKSKKIEEKKSSSIDHDDKILTDRAVQKLKQNELDKLINAPKQIYELSGDMLKTIDLFKEQGVPLKDYSLLKVRTHELRTNSYQVIQGFTKLQSIAQLLNKRYPNLKKALTNSKNKPIIDKAPSLEEGKEIVSKLADEMKKVGVSGSDIQEYVNSLSQLQVATGKFEDSLEIWGQTLEGMSKKYPVIKKIMNLPQHDSMKKDYKNTPKKKHPLGQIGVN